MGTTTEYVINWLETWKGYGEDTWEPAGDLLDPALLEDYKVRNKRACTLTGPYMYICTESVGVRSVTSQLSTRRSSPTCPTNGRNALRY